MGLFDQMEGMEDILNDFVIETTELIEQLDEDLLLLEGGNLDSDMVNRIFRCFHTIKGTSGFLNFTACNELAHAAENILNMIRNDELTPNAEIIDTLLESVDWFKGFVSDIENREEKTYEIEQLVAEIDAIQVQMTSQTPDVESAPSSGGNGSTQKQVDMPAELLTEFVSEAGELLESLDNDLLTLELEADDDEYVNTVFRAFHTLKGNSGLMGLDAMSSIAHKSEDLLGLLREKKVTVSSDIVDTLLSSVDFMRGIVEEVENHQIIPHDATELETRLLTLSGVKVAPSKKSTVTKAEGAKPAPRPTARKKAESTIRVDVERLDKLMNQAGELVLEKNRLIQLSQSLNQLYNGVKEVSDLDSLNNSLGMVTTEIQESVMQMRMLPVSNVFRKFPRMIRDLAKENNKEVELVINGEETELDRSVIEGIGDPLVHLLRNAIDHGLEDGDTREKTGKSRIGTVHLSAFQEGNYVVIELKDDGKGIDPDYIGRKAIEKNVMSEEEIKKLSEKEVINLVFRPGFSTAKVVTDVSGRGVGMDVVHSNISKLNGSVDIRSEVGKGTVFTIKIPLTLTIQTGMVVKICNETYIIPLANILETMKLQEDVLNTVQGKEIIKFRDSVLPIVRLDNWYNIHSNTDEERVQFIIVIAVSDRRFGLVVSELIGQEETVVKPLGDTLGKVPGIAGATIRGDGSICLIVDTQELAENLIDTREVA